jgi:glycosyltransferase involved in cell wall biosynthesis
LIVSVIQIDVKIAALVAASLKIPFVLMGQSLTTFYGPRIARQIKAWVFGGLVRRYASLVIAASSAVAEQFKSEHRVPAGRVEIIPNCIDLSKFTDREERSEEDHHALSIITVGRLDTQKGQDLLLQAVEMLPQEIRQRCTLSLVGDETISSPNSADFAETLRLLAGHPNLDGRIRFLGWRDDVPALLSRCDIYVHPARWEGLPLAVLEAMAAAAPVIFTDCFGQLDGFIQYKHGYRVPVGDVEALSHALETMIALPPDARLQMGRHARDLVRMHYDNVVLGNRFVERCERVVASESAQ